MARRERGDPWYVLAEREWVDRVDSAGKVGQELTQKWAGDWVHRWNIEGRIHDPNTIGFLSRLTAKTPEALRTILFVALSVKIADMVPPKFLASVPLGIAGFTAAKTGAAALVRSVPDVIHDKIRDGEIRPEELEVGVGAYLSSVWNSVRSLFTPFVAVDTAGDDMADDHGDKDTKKPDAPKAPDPAAVAKAAAVSEETLKKQQERLREEAARKRLEDMTRAQGEALALYRAILGLRFMRDDGPSPFEPHLVNRLLDFLGRCPGAIKALPRFNAVNLGRANTAIRFLRQRQERLEAGATIANRAAFAEETRTNERIIGDALERFERFEALLRQEALEHLTVAFERTRLRARDWIDRNSSPRTRARFRAWFGGTFQAIRESWCWEVTRDVILPVLAAILAVMAVLGLILAPVVAAALFLGAAGVGVFGALLATAAILWWIGGGATAAAYTFYMGVFLVAVSRVFVTVGDRVLDAVRLTIDFFNPADGTGIIGGTVAMIGDGIRDFFGATRVTPEERAEIRAMRLAQAAANSDSVGFVRNIATTVTLAGGIFTIVVGFLFMAYHHISVVPSWAIFTIVAAFIGVELFSRTWRIMTAVDEHRLITGARRRVAALAAINLADWGAVTFGVLMVVTGLMMGPGGADKALYLTQGLGDNAVDYVSAASGTRIPSTTKECRKARLQMEAEGATRDDVCLDTPSFWYCDCPIDPS